MPKATVNRISAAPQQIMEPRHDRRKASRAYRGQISANYTQDRCLISGPAQTPGNIAASSLWCRAQRPPGTRADAFLAQQLLL